MRNRFVLLITALFLPFGGTQALRAQIAAQTPNENPESNTGALKAQVTTGGSYDAHSGNATRTVTDLHVPGALGVYGLDFTRYWNSIDNSYDNMAAEWPLDFGGGWSHSWRWAAVYNEEFSPCEDGNCQQRTQTTSVTITFPDGHATKFKLDRHNYGPHPDLRLGPPYWQPPHDPQERNWPTPAVHVHDNLVDMEEDGSQFWLNRADGGAVHFIRVIYPDGHWEYQADKVFDPHGLRTDLSYTNGYLTQVKDEGNRWLTITWGTPPGWSIAVITRVETGGDAGTHTVTYSYKQFGGETLYGLATVGYLDDPPPGPGQIASAIYTAELTPYGVPLMRADDPHYPGAMTKIKYEYRGVGCGGRPEHAPSPIPAGFYDYFYFTADSIAAERSGETGLVVSRFDASCPPPIGGPLPVGERIETNGIGGMRKLYYGSSSHDSECAIMFGYMLTKVTDFAVQGANFDTIPCRKGPGPEPGSVWDGQHNWTGFDYLGGSGQPSDVHYVDGSNCHYERIDSSGSATPDYDRIHNQQHHWVFWKTDELGHRINYTRDNRRRVVRIDYLGDNSNEQYTYNEFNQITSHTLPSSAVVTYEYDEKHRLQREWNSVDRGIRTDDYKEYTYYGAGNHPEWADLVEIVIDGRARHSGAPFTAKMTYNGRGQVTSVEYPSTGEPGEEPHPTVLYEYDRYGNCTAIVDEKHHRREYTYDSYRRCTSYTEYVNAPGVVSRKWDWIYDRVIDYYGDGHTLLSYQPSVHTSKEWRVQVEPAFNSNGERRMTARWFDVNNRVTEEETGWIQPPGPIDGSNWYASPTDWERHRFTYDGNGQKSSYTDPKERLTTYEYDNRNRLWITTEYPVPGDASTPRTTTTLYDGGGNKTQVTFPDLKTQRWPALDYTAFGQPGTFIDELGNSTHMEYYHWGPMKKLLSVTTHRTKDNNQLEDQRTHFSPDGLGRPGQTDFPDGTHEITSYDYGQVSTWRTRRDQMKHILYDARGRETSNTWDGGTAPGVTRHWDEANRLKSIENSFALIDYTYDDASQVLTEGTTIAGSDGQTPLGGSVRRQIGYSRYSSGEVSYLTYPDGTMGVQHEYTARGQLHSAVWGSAGRVTYTYLADGKVDQQFYQNGLTTTFGYDGRGMISSIALRNTAHDLARRIYWRDLRDRITAWKRGSDNTVNGMEDERGDRYEYDWEGQLKNADYRALNPEASPSLALRGDRIEYDELGNRKGSSWIASKGAVSFARRDNGLNQYLSWTGSAIYHDDNYGNYDGQHPIQPWVYPGNGVSMADGYVTASFNALNQPIAIWSPTYQYTSNFMWFGYDPLGRCVKRWVGPDNPPNGPPVNTNTALCSYYYYDGWNLIQEGSSANNTTWQYVHGGRVDEIVASKAGGVWNYHHYDAQGNCIMLTMTNGGIREQYEYDAFGYPYVRDINGHKPNLFWGNRFLFTGREWLGDLRIYDFRNRQYQPELGRFLQPDPKEFDAGDYNLYRYCHNDPVNKTDPFGLADKVYDGAATPWSDNYNPPDRISMVAHCNGQSAVTVANGKATGNISVSRIAKDAIKAGYGESKNHVELSMCNAGSGGKNSIAQQVANALYERTGVKPDVSGPDGKTANPASVNDVTGKITSGPVTATADPTKGESGKMLHFTSGPKEPKEQKKDK